MNVNETALPQRKRLAHMPPVERNDRPVILFVTLTVQPRGDFLASHSFHAVFCEACREADAWLAGRYVIMPDHVHLFCAPGRWPTVDIRRWAQYLKRRMTIRLEDAARGDARPPGGLEGARAARGDARPPGGLEGARAARGDARPPTEIRTAHVGGRASPRAVPWRWQSDCWDTQIRDGDQYHAKWLYVRENPVRAGLVDAADRWPFQGEMNVLRW
jgi:REP element-mobilizing transposase RayT